MNIRQRFSLATSSFSGLTGGATENKSDIDDQLRTLYLPADEIDRKCLESAASYTNNVIRKSITTQKDGVGNMNNMNEEMETSYAKSPESVVEGLRAEYFTSDFDPIAPNLEEISTWEEEDMIEKFMTKIEEADTDKDVIIGHLTTMIDANYNDLVDCMRNVQSIDIDLCRAGIQIGHGRQRIRSACDIIHSGAIKVKALHSKRGKFSRMAETIRSLQALKGIHESMMANIKVGEVGKAANHAKSLLECLQSEAYGSYLALKSIGASTEKSVVTIRQKCDKALKRICSRKFSAADYENVMSAYVVLDHLSETMAVQMYDMTDKMTQDSSASFYFDRTGCVEGLSQRINRFQLDDIDACLHMALTQYIDSSQIRPGNADDAVGAYMQQRMAMGAAAEAGLGDEEGDITDVPLNLLYRHLTADVIAPCVVRTCELLADVVHTHFLLTQWHRSPFDPQNMSAEYLHRQPLEVKIVGADDAPSNVVHVQTNRTSLSSNNSTTNSAAQSPNMNPRRVESHSEIIDLGREFHDEESDGEEDDDLQDGDEALNALASTYRKLSQVQSTLSEETTNAVIASFEMHFPHILSRDRDIGHLSLVSPGSGEEDRERTGEGAGTDGGGSDSAPNCGLQMADVLDRLQQSRAILWEEMLRALVNMLNMMTFTSEVKIEDFLAMAWALNHIVDLGREFCGSQSQALINTLEHKSREYFHNFHCESFQMIRDMLEAESWLSVPIDLELSGGILGIIKTTLLRDAARAGKICFASGGTVVGEAGRDGDSDVAAVAVEGTGTPGTTSDNTEASGAAVATVATSILMRFGAEGNPFHFTNNAGGAVVSSSVLDASPRRKETQAGADIERKELRAFWKLLQDGSADTPAKSKRIAEQSAFTVVTQTALNGVAKCVAKYLHLMYLLPASSKCIFDHLTQLFDYYLCSVFNGFMPFEERQRFLADITKQNAPPPNCSMEFESLQEYLERALDMLVDTTTTDAAFDAAYDDASDAGAKLGGEGRGSSGALDVSEHTGANPASMNSGESSPVHSHANSSNTVGTTPAAPTGSTAVSGPTATTAATPQVPLQALEGTKMSLLLRPPAIPLNIESTCMALNERIVAAESCCFISMILLELKSKLMKLVPAEHVAAVEQFVTQYQRVAGQLRALIYRALCPQLIKFNSILVQITDCAWDSKKMRSEVHDWVPRLADNCRAVWDYMMLTEQFAESSPLLREQVWFEICQCAFDVCLEGYSKARKVSVEGRSAMTTDNIALHDALNTVHLCRPPRGKHYVDNYLRSAMLSEEELMAWVRENWESYAYRHIHGLLTQTLFSLLNSKKLKDATAVIDALYELKDGESTSTLGMLSQSADATFSRAFNSTFRRQTLMTG